MARPKLDSTRKSAKDRIKDAFWKILEEGCYTDITIKKISLLAHVNHKTIYYHYANIDAMANELFLDEIKDFPKVNLLELVVNNKFDKEFLETNPILIERIMRVQLYTRNDSAYLNTIFKENIKQNWLNSLNVSADELTIDEEIDLDFILSGITTLLGHIHTIESIYGITTIFKRELGKGVISTLIHIRTRHQSK